ncbi:MAG TPA: hypothetical protein VL094_10185 [Sphingomonadaceae bacterium]|nr:hypothetical protein [Sphingomonadaceae bacterium]
MYKKRPRLKLDTEKLRVRIFLWGVAGTCILMAAIATVGMLDGDSRFLWKRTVSISVEPLHFAASAVACGLLWFVGAIAYLAAIGWDRPNSLPRRLRDKPLVLITFLIAMTAGTVLGGIELASGETTVRGLGHISSDGTPIRYSLFVLAYMAFCAVLALGWYIAFSEWKHPETRRWKPEFEDPGKRGRM